jgi:hypothetical protein
VVIARMVPKRVLGETLLQSRAGLANLHSLISGFSA